MRTQFVIVEVPLRASAIAFRQAIEAELRSLGTPLRWAVTAVNEQMAQIEAIVTTNDEQS